MNRSSIKMLFLKISKNSQKKTLCWSLFLNKNAGPQTWNFIKRGFFLVNIAKFLRTPVLENICESLFERFPTWASNITGNMGIDVNNISKTTTKKKNQNLARWKKTYLFMILLFISFFSISPLHVSGGVCPT